MIKRNPMKNAKYFFQFLLLLTILFSAVNCSDFDDNLKIDETATGEKPEVITKTSELYQLIERVTDADNTDPVEKIVCIDFVYPMEILIYDENLETIGSQVFIGDSQFSSFLGTLPDDQSLSISYPITTTFENGETFSVNNNDELKLAIDNCSREDIVLYCNNVFCGNPSTPGTNCVWNVKYSADSDNKYVGGTFFINPDGRLIFNYNLVDYPGSWVFLFVDDQLHLNINLEGTSAVASDWNIDRKIFFADGNIVIENTPKNTILKQNCESATTYIIGQTGPANGIVFYDKGFYSNGWRYMEASNEIFGAFEWGCSGTAVANTDNTGIGRGLINTAAIANFHDGLANYYNNPGICNALNNGSVAAKNVIIFEQGNNGWLLPSEDELMQVYINLHLSGIRTFTASYWTSTQTDVLFAKSIDFTTGMVEDSPKLASPTPIKTMAVRYF